MKIAISGKGGVGKTLLSSLLARRFAEAGYSVIAIDADPDANLAATLGFPDADKIVPISEMKELIEERTGAKPGSQAPFFKLNPRVDDIPEKYAHNVGGIRLMRMGRLKRGGSGCYCPENALLQALMSHLLVARNEAIILDMEAGIEHLGRGTATAVDWLIVVVEPGRRSIETAMSIKGLAAEIGLRNIGVVANKIRGDSDIAFLKSALPGFQFLGFVPYDPAIVNADLATGTSLDASQPAKDAVNRIYQALSSGQERSDGGKAGA